MNHGWRGHGQLIPQPITQRRASDDDEIDRDDADRAELADHEHE
jgi:hypothetical protein